MEWSAPWRVEWKQWPAIRQDIRKRPFQPFRLFVSDGCVYEVRHPELIMLGRRSVAVGVTTDPAQTIYHHLATVDLLHVTGVEPLESVGSCSSQS
jgi:hypothetical protein